MSEHEGIRARCERLVRDHWVTVVAWLVLACGWEVAAATIPPGSIAGAPRVPSVQFLLTTTVKELSQSWTVHLWAPTPITGGRETYLGGVLAIAYSSAFTAFRVLLGLTAGVVAGVGCGLVIGYSRIARHLVWGPLNFLRMVPMLAAIPLFEFWFGADTIGSTVFVGFGVWLLLVVATIVAVNNVARAYSESARTLGASRLQTYRRVVVPGAIPELRTTLILAGAASWSLATGAEYLGMKVGLGTIMATAQATANTGRLIAVGFCTVLYALLTFVVLLKLFGYLTRWR